VLGVQSLGPSIPCRVAEAMPAEGLGGLSAGDRAEADLSDRRTGPGDSGVAPIRSMAGDASAFATFLAPETVAERERDAWVILLSVPGLGPVSFGALLGAFGSARAVLAAAAEPAGPARLLEALADAAADGDGESRTTVFDSCAGTFAEAGSTPAAGGAGGPRRRPLVGGELAARICEAASSGGRAAEQVRALGLTVVTLEEQAYPDRLRRVELPPPLLFVRGCAAALNPGHAVAVVGTRWPTDKGRLIAGWIGSAVARAGAVVVSGLAVGIDGAAHASVVAEGGRTVAVLGGGHARLFPRAHERLADAIVEAGGAVVSELPPETSPSRGTFPRRNRLVSGLSDATVVVEAGRRSGALITAGWALEQGRECFLVPGPFDAPTSAGCHAFLRSFPGQARVVAGIAELVEDLELDGGPEVSSVGAEETDDRHSGRAETGGRPAMPRAGRAAVMASLGPVERSLAEELARGPATADQLADRASVSVAAVLSALTLLELRGLATAAYGRYSPAGSLAGWSGPGKARDAASGLGRSVTGRPDSAEAGST
jgi:DNA processing protein